MRDRRRPRRGRVPGRRRLAGARDLDDPARAPGRRPQRARDLDLHRRGAARQPPDDRGLPRERLPGRAALDARTRSRSSCRPRCRPPALARFEERERTAAVAAVRSFLEPQSVAVIGASRRRGTVGGEVLHNLLAAEFNGAVYAVNRRRRRGPVAAGLPVDQRHSRRRRPRRGRGARRSRSWGSRASAPPPACAPLLVISAGFAEAGEEGAAPAAGAASRSAARPACGSSARTASACSTPRRRPAQRDVRAAPRPRPDASASCRRAAASGSRSSRPPAGWASACPRSCRSATRPTCRATTCSSTGSRTRHRRRAAVPRVVRQPAQVRADRAAVRRAQAGPGGQERPLGGRRPRHVVAHGSAAVGLGRDGRRPVRAGGRDPHRHAARAVRRRRAADDAARARGATGSRSSPTAAVRGSCAPTPARPTASRSPSCRRSVQARLAGVPPGAASLGNPVDMIATATADDYRRTIQTLIDADACDAILAIFVPPLVTEAVDVARAIREVGRGPRTGGGARGGVHDRREGRRRSWAPSACGCRATSSPRMPRARWRWRPSTDAGAPGTRRPVPRLATSDPERGRGDHQRGAGARAHGWLDPSASPSCSTATGCRWSPRRVVPTSRRRSRPRPSSARRSR